MTNVSNLTEKQEEIINRLPNTRRSIAEDLDISIRSVRYRMDAIEDKNNVYFVRDKSGIWSINQEKENDLNKDTDESNEPWRVDSYSKAQATKDMNNALTKIEQDMKDALSNRNIKYSNFKRDKKSSTLVIPRSDDHFGVKIDGRGINSEYSTPIARERINYIFDHAINESEERGDVEDVVVGLFGDHIDGEKVYPGHHVNIEKYLRGQIREAAKIYINQLEKLSEKFENVLVVTCPGNHGSFGDGVISNADDIVYDEIELGIDLLDIDNINFKHSPNSVYVDFNIRGWNAYARHGQDALEHASTSSGDDRWMNWKEESDFDIAYHGHHHQLRTEPVGYAQLYQCGTPIPPSLFVNQIGETGVPRVFYHFTSNERLVDGVEIIDFNEKREELDN